MSADISAIRNTFEDEKFKAAKALADANKYNDAVEQFSELLSSMVEEHGDLGAAMFPVYYEYGRACLLQAESSSNCFGESVKMKKDETDETKEGEEKEQGVEEMKVIMEGEGEEEEEGEGEGEGEGDEDQEGEEEEEEEEGDEDQEGEEDPAEGALNLLIEEYIKKTGKEPTDEVLKSWMQTLQEAALEAAQEGTTSGADKTEDQPAQTTEPVLGADEIEELMTIAWETLESARVILHKLLESHTSASDIAFIREWLSNVYLRLGDLGMERGIFNEALEDYTKSLDFTKQTCSVWDPKFADVYVHLAASHHYNSSTAAGVTEMRESQMNSMKYYILSIHAIASNRNHLLNLEAIPEPSFDVDESSLEASDDTSSKKAKKETPVATENADEIPPLSALEQAKLDKAKQCMEAIEKAIERSKTDAKNETPETLDKLQLIEEMKNRVEDIVELFEKPEAQQAILGQSADIVEEALDGASSGFDKPTLPSSSSGPTNLLQVRKRASPDDADPSLVSEESAPATNVLQPKRKVRIAEDETSAKRSKGDQA